MPTRTAPLTDRRKGTDRRKVDQGPPRGRERRVGMEPRKPEVQELDFSASDWTRLQGESTPRK